MKANISFIYIFLAMMYTPVLAVLKPFKYQPHKIVKHTQTTRQQKPTYCLSVSDHFVGLPLKGLTILANITLDGKYRQT